MDSLFTYKEAAKILKCSECTLRRWVMDGRLAHCKVGRKSVRFTPEQLDAVVREFPAHE